MYLKLKGKLINFNNVTHIEINPDKLYKENDPRRLDTLEIHLVSGAVIHITDTPKNTKGRYESVLLYIQKSGHYIGWFAKRS